MRKRKCHQCEDSLHINGPCKASRKQARRAINKRWAKTTEEERIDILQEVRLKFDAKFSTPEERKAYFSRLGKTTSENRKKHLQQNLSKDLR